MRPSLTSDYLKVCCSSRNNIRCSGDRWSRRARAPASSSMAESRSNSPPAACIATPSRKTPSDIEEPVVQSWRRGRAPSQRSAGWPDPVPHVDARIACLREQLGDFLSSRRNRRQLIQPCCVSNRTEKAARGGACRNPARRTSSPTGPALGLAATAGRFITVSRVRIGSYISRHTNHSRQETHTQTK